MLQSHKIERSSLEREEEPQSITSHENLYPQKESENP